MRKKRSLIDVRERFPGSFTLSDIVLFLSILLHKAPCRATLADFPCTRKHFAVFLRSYTLLMMLARLKSPSLPIVLQRENTLREG